MLPVQISDVVQPPCSHSPIQAAAPAAAAGTMPIAVNRDTLPAWLQHSWLVEIGPEASHWSAAKQNGAETSRQWPKAGSWQDSSRQG